MTELHDLDIANAGRRLRDGSLTSVKLTEALLDRIGRYDDKLQVFVRVTSNSALDAAAAADRKLAAGVDLGPLHGIPIGVKDLYDTAGVPTTSCSRIRADYVPSVDSTAVAKLREAGAIILGKVSTHEFAFGFDAPPTRNPWNTECTPSGSSGGSAAGLAAGFFLGATGSDTGGSIRAPSAACGVCGIKPTYGRVSKHGVAVLSWSLDHAGPMARTVADLVPQLQVLAGHDHRDPTTIDVPVPNYAEALTGDVGGLTIGVPRNYFFDKLLPEIESGVRQVADELGSAGARIVDVDIPGLDHMLEIFLSIVQPEAAAYHLQSFRRAPDRYGDDVRELLGQGNLVAATTYIHALRARAAVCQSFAQVFDQVDVLLAPGLPVTAPKVSQTEYDWGDSAESVFAAHARYNCPTNLAGLPSTSAPCGFANNGLPIGFQIIGRPLDEAMTLRVADTYQRRTDWHLRRPVF